jgi:hypothetical protein
MIPIIMDNKKYENIIDSAIDSKIAERKKNLSEQIEKLNKKINKLNKGSFVLKKTDNDGACIYDRMDQIRILKDMDNDLPHDIFIENTRHGKCGSLFFHADNIRYVYATVNKKCPKWFINKYGHLFNMN